MMSLQFSLNESVAGFLNNYLLVKKPVQNKVTPLDISQM